MVNGIALVGVRFEQESGECEGQKPGIAAVVGKLRVDMTSATEQQPKT